MVLAEPAILEIRKWILAIANGTYLFVTVSLAILLFVTS